MFIQVIRGTATDREGLRRQFDRWNTELRPGAAGFLGSAAGITDDGRFIAVARFESAVASHANSPSNWEVEARQGETKEMPADVSALFNELMSAIAVDEYLDLKDPWIV